MPIVSYIFINLFDFIINATLNVLNTVSLFTGHACVLHETKRKCLHANKANKCEVKWVSAKKKEKYDESLQRRRDVAAGLGQSIGCSLLPGRMNSHLVGTLIWCHTEITPLPLTLPLYSLTRQTNMLNELANSKTVRSFATPSFPSLIVVCGRN